MKMLVAVVIMLTSALCAQADQKHQRPITGNVVLWQHTETYVVTTWDDPMLFRSGTGAVEYLDVFPGEVQVYNNLDSAFAPLVAQLTNGVAGTVEFEAYASVTAFDKTRIAPSLTLPITDFVVTGVQGSLSLAANAHQPTNTVTIQIRASNGIVPEPSVLGSIGLMLMGLASFRKTR